MTAAAASLCNNTDYKPQNKTQMKSAFFEVIWTKEHKGAQSMIGFKQHCWYLPETFEKGFPLQQTFTVRFITKWSVIKEETFLSYLPPPSKAQTKNETT